MGHRINSGGGHWRQSCVRLQMGRGAGGSWGELSIVTGDMFSAPWECWGSEARIAWHAVRWLRGPVNTHTHTLADSELPEVC